MQPNSDALQRKHNPAMEIEKNPAFTQMSLPDNCSTFSIQVNSPLAHAKIMLWSLGLPQLSFLANYCSSLRILTLSHYCDIPSSREQHRHLAERIIGNGSSFVSQSKPRGFGYWGERPRCWSQTSQLSSFCWESALYVGYCAKPKKRYTRDSFFIYTWQRGFSILGSL